MCLLFASEAKLWAVKGKQQDGETVMGEAYGGLETPTTGWYLTVIFFDGKLQMDS